MKVKSLLIFTVMAAMLLSFCSCAKKAEAYPALRSLPEKYTQEMAKKDGDVIEGFPHYHESYNGNKLEVFYKNFKAKKDGQVRVTIFTDEGGTVIHDLISRDGKTELTVDETRDEYSSQKITSYEVNDILKKDYKDIHGKPFTEYTAVFPDGKKCYVGTKYN